MAHAREEHTRQMLQMEIDVPPPSYTDLNGGTVNAGFENEEDHTDKQHAVTIESNGTVTGEMKEKEDPWKVTTIQVNETVWRDLTLYGKTCRLLKYIVGLVLILAFLYMFVCSLDFLSSAFKLLGGKQAGRVFQQNTILNNPVAGLMMGILVTVLVQSSSTSTSLIISMVGGGLLQIRSAIPMVMGANIGTSVTNTIVALGQVVNKGDFRRAFAGATVHDMFNWLSVIVLLPLEIITGYLFHLSEVIIKTMHMEQNKAAKKELLKVITKPFTELVIQIDKSIITDIAKGKQVHEADSMMKTCCDKVTPLKCCSNTLEDASESWYTGANYTYEQKAQFCYGELPHCVKKPACMTTFWESKTTMQGTFEQFVCESQVKSESCCSIARQNNTWLNEHRNFTIAEKVNICSSWTRCEDRASNCMTNAWNYTKMMSTNDSRSKEEFSCATWIQNETQCQKPCEYLFKGLAGEISDEAIGAIMLILSIVILCICLICIVKLLNLLLRGQIAVIIKTFINASFPGYMSYFTGYLAILIGAGLTILVQSSSIFTSTLTPLVGIGVIELDRMYPLTLGANIGTTTTGILAALAQSSDTIADSLQVAFCHLFFNISGIVIFYPIPFLRLPIPLAKFLGNETAKYRWFSVVYLLVMFFLFPGLVFGLSLAGWEVLAGVLIPVSVLVVAIAILKTIQHHKPSILPKKLQNWKFLPEIFRSLDPLDRVMQKILCKCCSRFQDHTNEEKSIVLTAKKSGLQVYEVNTHL